MYNFTASAESVLFDVTNYLIRISRRHLSVYVLNKTHNCLHESLLEYFEGKSKRQRNKILFVPVVLLIL
jgi:hypothetical protein